MMALELYMVGLIAQDMDKSLEFYRRVGLAIPESDKAQEHVGVKMESGLTFFLNAGRGLNPGQPETADGCRIILEFYLPSRAAVEAKY
ncbi:MAG: hypothetical protein J2P37_16595, partial [Ktedonobacteraceae bacterium]|nr:hypothetical protein [Ktedonobacteraceae bacterium]